MNLICIFSFLFYMTLGTEENSVKLLFGFLFMKFPVVSWCRLKLVESHF